LIAKNYLSCKNEGVSLINDHVNVGSIIIAAYEDAKYLCKRKYTVAPALKIEGSSQNFKYIPSHLYSITHELIKNAMEATILNHINRELPEVIIKMCNNNSNLSILIHDEGAGVPAEDLQLIWSHFYSTSSDSVYKNIEDPSTLLDSSVLSGFGFGLPITKMLVQYFGGDIFLNSIHGICTDVHLYFQGNEDPKYNRINPNNSY